MRKIGIIGLGLIGGSLAKALNALKKPPEIIAMDINQAALDNALREGVITAATTEINGVFSDCGIIFICTPVNLILSAVEQLSSFIKEDCIITDVGSTKGNIYEKMRDYPSIRYIGGHPMAGSEQSGYAASKEFLFENAYYILTPSPEITPEETEKLEALLRSISAIPIVISPELHDKSVAAVSHVPHVIASALVNTVEMLDDPEKTMYTLAAGGFRDITRIASAEPEMWEAVCLENSTEVLKILDTFIDLLSGFKYNLTLKRQEQINSFFQNAKVYRDNLQVKNAGGYMNTYQVFVDVLDRPGIIATLATMLSVNNINIKNIGIVNSREYENGILQIIFETKENMEKSVKLLKEMNFTVYES